MVLNQEVMRNLPFSQAVLSDFSQSLQWSEHFTIGIVLEGRLRVRYQEKVHECRPHDIYFFPPFEIWSIAQHTKSARVFQIQIHSSYISRMCPDVIKVRLNENYLTEDFSDKIYLSLGRDLASLVKNERKRELCTQFKLMNALHRMLITIFETFGEFTEESGNTTYMADRIYGILTYINEHYTEKVTGADIAKHLGLHPAYFSSFFHKQFGIGFVEYLNTYRVNQSIPVLLRTDKSIMEIALDHGFSNHKTYAAAFRKTIGMSPTEYRKEQRQSGSKSYIIMPEQELADEKKGSFAFFERFETVD